MPVIGPFGYTGGLNANTGAYDCPQNSYVDAQNVELVNNRLAECLGNSLWTTGSHPGGPGIMGFISLFANKLVVYCGSKIATASSTLSGAWTDITGAVTFTPTVGNDWAAVVNSVLVLGGGDTGPTTTPIQWTGTGNCTTVAGSPPLGCYCGTSVNNYLFMANNNTYPFRVFWSAVGDQTNWPAANFVDVRPEGTDNQVNALLPFGEDLLIFKKKGIARFYTNQLAGQLGPLVFVNEKIGALYSRNVANMPDGRVCFFGSDLHMYIYDGNTFTDISDQPQPQSNIQPILNSLGASSSQMVVFVYQKKHQIWLAYNGPWTNALGTTYQNSGVIFKYDYINNIWLSPCPDRSMYAAIGYVTTSTPYQEVVMVSQSNAVYQEDIGNANNTAGKSSSSFDTYITHSIPFGSDNRNFIPRSVFYPINSGTFSGTVYYGANGYNNPSLSKSISITGASAERKKVIPLNSGSGVWNTGQFRFDGAISNQPFTLSPFYLSDQIESQI